MSKNKKNKETINHELSSSNKKLQVSDNKYKNKTFLVFILKGVFIFIVILSVIVLLISKAVIPSSLGYISLVLICIGLLIFILFNYIKHSNRNAIYFHKTNFKLEKGVPSPTEDDADCSE